MIKLGGLVNLKPINEAENDKYTHIGYGKYKLKGKEDDKTSPTFEKDGEKFVPTKGDKAAKGGDSSAGEETPKVNIFKKDKEEPKSEPAKDSTGDRAGNSEINKAVRAKAKEMGLTPQKLGNDEYKKKMAQAAVAALTDANFHSEARQLIADLEGKPEMAEKPDYPSMDDPKFDEKMKAIRAKYDSEYSEPDGDTEQFGIDVASEAGWGGADAVDAIAFDLKMNGFKDLASKIQSVVKENKSTRLTSLLPESNTLNEGTRSQVGIIKGGKIVSAYVHFDGYPSNMKPSLKKHMKDEKDVMTLIKKGGARGIFDDKDEIEYYKSGTPMKGDENNIADYIKDADMKNGAEFVYLYNTKDKKWYYADTYKDSKLKKLY